MKKLLFLLAMTGCSHPVVASPLCKNNACYAHYELAKEIAEQKQVPLPLAIKTVTRESRWNANARGMAQEWGLTQIKCETAQSLGFRGRCAQLLNPRTNLTWGFEHLRLALLKCGGNWHYASTLHNRGLGASCSKSRYSHLVLGG